MSQILFNYKQEDKKEKDGKKEDKEKRKEGKESKKPKLKVKKKSKHQHLEKDTGKDKQVLLSDKF